MPPSAVTITTPRAWLLVLVVALAARAGWGTYRMANAGAESLEFPDEEQYWLMADSWLKGEGLRDELGFQATRMPLYPSLLALAAGLPHGIVWARIVQWGIGACGAVLALMLGSRVGGPRVGLIAGLIFALDPFLVFFSSLLLTETLFITLLVGLWAYVAPFAAAKDRPAVRDWLTITLLALGCVYARESTLGLIALGSVVYLFCSRFERSAVRGIILLALGLAAGLAPWAVRNRLVLGEWCWLTTRSGISLYDGVRPQATGAGDLGDVKQSEAVRGMNEVEWNRYFLRESWNAIREEPGRIASLAGRKFARMWNPIPNVETYRSPMIRLISAAWMGPVLLCALAGAVVSRRLIADRAAAATVFLLMPAVYLTLLHMIFVGSVRYRLGAMPMIGVLAALGVTAIFGGRRPAAHERRHA